MKKAATIDQVALPIELPVEHQLVVRLVLHSLGALGILEVAGISYLGVHCIFHRK